MQTTARVTKDLKQTKWGRCRRSGCQRALRPHIFRTGLRAAFAALCCAKWFEQKCDKLLQSSADVQQWPDRCLKKDRCSMQPSAQGRTGVNCQCVPKRQPGAWGREFSPHLFSTGSTRQLQKTALRRSEGHGFCQAHAFSSGIEEPTCALRGGFSSGVEGPK